MSSKRKGGNKKNQKKNQITHDDDISNDANDILEKEDDLMDEENEVQQTQDPDMDDFLNQQGEDEEDGETEEKKKKEEQEDATSDKEDEEDNNNNNKKRKAKDISKTDVEMEHAQSSNPILEETPQYFKNILVGKKIGRLGLEELTKSPKAIKWQLVDENDRPFVVKSPPMKVTYANLHGVGNLYEDKDASEPATDANRKFKLVVVPLYKEHPKCKDNKVDQETFKKDPSLSKTSHDFRNRMEKKLLPKVVLLVAEKLQHKRLPKKDAPQEKIDEYVEQMLEDSYSCWIGKAKPEANVKSDEDNGMEGKMGFNKTVFYKKDAQNDDEKPKKKKPKTLKEDNDKKEDNNNNNDDDEDKISKNDLITTFEDFGGQLSKEEQQTIFTKMIRKGFKYNKVRVINNMGHPFVFRNREGKILQHKNNDYTIPIVTSADYVSVSYTVQVSRLIGTGAVIISLKLYGPVQLLKINPDTSMQNQRIENSSLFDASDFIIDE